MSEPSDLLSQLLAVLRVQRLRTQQLLAAAHVENRRAGEDAIWLLLQQGRVVIGPDSTLRLVDEQASPSRGKRSRSPSIESRYASTDAGTEAR